MSANGEHVPVLEQEQSTTENKGKPSLFRVMFFSFFVVPMLIALAGVALFSGAYWLIADEPDALSLIQDVQHSYTNKRWQAAYHLVSMFDGPNTVEITPEIRVALLEAFEDSAEDDEAAIRQYLAMAMGCTGDRAFTKPLMDALATDPIENKPFIVRALGRMGDAYAAEVVAPLLQSDKVSLRLESAIALGAMGNRVVIPQLKQALQDTEPNVQWDAAIALAKLGDTSGSKLLIQLMDRDYIAKFEEVNPSETKHILQVVIQVAAALELAELDQAIEAVAQGDPNMDVRQTAQRALNQRASQQAAQHRVNAQGGTV